MGRSITKAMRIGTGEETRNGRHFSSGLASLYLDSIEMMLNARQLYAIVSPINIDAKCYILLGTMFSVGEKMDKTKISFSKAI